MRPPAVPMKRGLAARVGGGGVVVVVVVVAAAAAVTVAGAGAGAVAVGGCKELQRLGFRD